MPETRYAGDLIEHRLKYMAEVFVWSWGILKGRTCSRTDLTVSPQGVLHFRTVGSCSSERRFRANSPPRAPQSQEENGSCFGSETLSQNGMDYSGTGSAREAETPPLTPGARGWTRISKAPGSRPSARRACRKKPPSCRAGQSTL